MSEEQVGGLMIELTNIRKELNSVQESIDGDVSAVRKVLDIIERSGKLPSVHVSNVGQARYISIGDTENMNAMFDIVDWDKMKERFEARQELYEKSCRLRDMLEELGIDVN